MQQIDLHKEKEKTNNLSIKVEEVKETLEIQIKETKKYMARKLQVKDEYG